jgi:prolyl oligopeptidase PreP (S9A serine peptidase family)/Tol biopolymer transport system component
MRTLRLGNIALSALVCLPAAAARGAERERPPETRRDPIVEQLHGVLVEDPYRWLEDQEAPATRAWIAAQNAYTERVIAPLPGKDAIRRRLTELLKIDSVSVPFARGGRLFFSKRSRHQNLSVLYVRKTEGGADEVLVDPHALSPDQTVSVTFQDVSQDGKTLVYGVRQGGQDEVELRILDVDTLQHLKDRLPRARYSGVSLTNDKKALYYSRQTPSGPRVFVHRLGGDPAADEQIFGEGYGPEKLISAALSDDGRYLRISVAHGSAARKSELYVQDLQKQTPMRPIVNDIDAAFGGPMASGRLFLRTNWNAPNWRVLAVDLENSARENWREIVKESRAVITGVSVAGGRLFVSTLENVQSRLRVHLPDGTLLREVPLPSIGSVGGVSGDWDRDEAFFSFSSLARPSTIYRYVPSSGRSEVWARQDVPVNSDDVEVRQVFYASKDGTRIPMFVAHKRGLAKDGQRPALLTGYGGFNLSQNPGFSARAAFWIENGGVYALPNLRGGGEFGEDWHKAGMLANKQNVFDDFIAAAEWLIASGYTAPEKLVISGGSNGGLLVGAALTQRPELFRAVVCSYPLLDMLRYHKFMVAGYWVPEYGSAEDAGQFRVLRAYSPYHRVKDGGKYPAVLFITGDGDTRVAPLHARKMAARLQAASGSERPVLLRYDTKAGHSGGMPVDKTIADSTDEMRFLFGQVGIDVAGAPAPANAAPASARPITETDLFRFLWIADPQLSPDGGQVAFVRVNVDAKKEGYETAIFSVAADGSGEPRRFTNGPRDSAPRFSPDGQRLAFLRATEREGRPQPAQLYLMPTSGGEPRALTDLPRGVASPAWSPDGRTIAFTSTANAEDMRKKKHSPKTPERESDVRVITRAVYRSNGGGYSDPARPSHIWTIEVPGDAETAPEPKQITSGEFAEQNAAWAPDASRIYFTSTRVREPYYEPPSAALFWVPREGGAITKVVAIEGSIGAFALSPDGKRLAFRGVSNARPVRSYNQPDLFVASSAPGSVARNLTSGYDFDVASGITGDQHAPRAGAPSPPLWSRDGRFVYVVGAEHGRANLKRVDAASGKLEPVTRGDQEVVAYVATPDLSRVVALVSNPTEIGDLHLVDPATGLLRRLTRVNEPLFAELRLSRQEEIWHASFDGRRIHSFVLKPPDFDPKKKYPLILNIHGGPHAAYGYTFDHEFQWMAAKGYVVVYPNPRGSTTYGQEFGNIIQHRYPGDDYKDLMAAVDEVIERGYVDPTKLGVTGGSGGGVLTNWTITQTGRFAAAVSQRSIADWAGFWYTADFTLFQPSWFRGAPFEDPKDFAYRSAITHVAKVKTPLMLIEGEADLRTPASDGGEQMFRALKYRRIPTVMVRFPDESHELSRSGKPWHRVERLQHIVGWFDKYLLRKNGDAYAPH